MKLLLEKYGTFDWENIKRKKCRKRKSREIMELRQKLLLLEKKNPVWRRRWRMTRQSLDIMIDIAEKEYDRHTKNRAPAVRQGKEVTGSPIGQIWIARDKQTDVLQKELEKEKCQKSASRGDADR